MHPHQGGGNGRGHSSKLGLKRTAGKLRRGAASTQGLQRPAWQQRVVRKMQLYLHDRDGSRVLDCVGRAWPFKAHMLLCTLRRLGFLPSRSSSSHSSWKSQIPPTLADCS